MEEVFGGAVIKLAVDVTRCILAGGGELQAEDGSRQEDVGGADWYPQAREVGFESLINIRPRQGNFGLEVQDPTLREQIGVVLKVS